MCSDRTSSIDSGTGRAGRSRSGQAMLEYVLTAAMLTASILILAVFLYTTREANTRVLDLVASDTLGATRVHWIGPEGVPGIG